jgi:galactokinase
VTDAATLAGHLVSVGLDEAERAAKAQLFQRTLDRWQRDIGSAPAAAWWVPGRLEVFGTHTDYAGGRSLVAPVPRGFVFLAASRLDRQIRAIDAKDVRDPWDKRNASHQESVAISQEQSPARFRGWRHYVEVTAARLARNFPGSELGTDIAFASDLPRAAGMSSSSALIVGIAIALSHAGRLRERPEWQADVRSIVDEAGYLGCVENGRAFGALTGDAGVGTHGGSEDHAAMLAGTAGACSEFAFVPLRLVETVSIPPAWTFVVASSGIGSHKTGSERGAYNRLSAGTAVLLDLWNRRETPCDSLGAALASSESALERLRAIAERSAVPDWSGPALRDRLDHFAREDGRVAESVLALRRADADTFGRLAAESQADAELLLANQVPETSALVRVARDAGAVAARSFGAGFGGSAWAMIESAGEKDDRQFLDRWMSAYRSTCPEASAHSVAFVSKPGPPVTRVK